MRVEFRERKDDDPDRLVRTAELHFEAGPLAGTKLVGFTLWKGADGETYVTCPTRGIVPRGGGLKYHDILQPAGDDPPQRPTLALKAWILSEFAEGRTPAPEAVATVEFGQVVNGPERKVSEAELHFAGGPLDGLKLVGFALWRGADGETYVTFPARAVGVGTERRFFDFVRSSEGNAAPMRALKTWILDAFQAEQERSGARCHAAAADFAPGPAAPMDQLASPAAGLGRER